MWDALVTPCSLIFKTKTMNKEIIILSGIPCSGKTTWRNEKMKQVFTRCVCRDDIRAELFPGKYIYTTASEDKVTAIQNCRLKILVMTTNTMTIIIDNTHCKEGYLDRIITEYGKNNTIKVMFFDVSLWKAHYRNIVRVLSTGKWIPFKIINIMYKNFNKIKREKYKQYSGELFF